MCTIAVATRVWHQAPLVIAANRDERLDRPATGPELWPSEGTLVAPRDLQAGGTWWGVRDGTLFAGVTNRFGAPPDRTRRSRGELVLKALEHTDVDAAASAMEALEATTYNSFHLVLASAEAAEVVWSDGQTVCREALGPGVHHVTERSFGAASSGRHQALDEALERLVDAPEPPDVPTLAGLLGHHAGDRGFDGTCVHIPSWTYGTRSSSMVWLGALPRLLFADGPPCTTTFEDVSALLRG